MTLPRLSAIFVLLTLAQVALALVFPSGDGFYAWTEGGGTFRCRDLASSGSDDQVVTLIFLALPVPAAWRLLRLRATPGRAEVATWAILLFGGAALARLGMDCGQATATLFGRGEPVLLAFTLCTLAAAATMRALVRRRPAPDWA